MDQLKVFRSNPTLFLTSEAGPPDLWAEVDRKVVDELVNTIFMEVRKPNSLVTEGSETMQANLVLTQQFMNPDSSITERVRYTWPGDDADLNLFADPGKYQVLFYARSNLDLAISEPKAIQVYRASGTALPSAFNLEAPQDGAQVDFLATGTLGLFSWSESTSSGSEINNIFRLWEDADKTELALESSPLSANFFLISPNELPNAIYWWDVVAVDSVGNFTTSTDTFQVALLSTNAETTGSVSGTVYDRITGSPIPDFDIDFENLVGFAKHEPSGQQFTAILAPRPEPFSITVRAPGYKNFPLADISIESQTKLVFEIPMSANLALIRINPGWNLCSIPLVENALASSRVYDQLLTKSGQDIILWKWGRGRFDSVKKLVPGVGYLLRSNETLTLDPGNHLPSFENPTVGPGWVLVGVVGTEPIDVDSGGNAVASIWAWDSLGQKYYSISSQKLAIHDRNKMAPGAGYWIYLRSEQTLDLGGQ